MMIIIASITSYSQISLKPSHINIPDSVIIASMRDLPKIAQAMIQIKYFADHGYRLNIPDYSLYPTHFQSFKSALNEFKERLEDEIWKFEK